VPCCLNDMSYSTRREHSPCCWQLCAVWTQHQRQTARSRAEHDNFLIIQALENRLDPVIGRSREVARVMQILARRRKNNPMLLGEPGVGKTAIAEGLALAIVNGKGDDGTELPLFLKGGGARNAPAMSSPQANPGW